MANQRSELLSLSGAYQPQGYSSHLPCYLLPIYTSGSTVVLGMITEQLKLNITVGPARSAYSGDANLNEIE
jgi:hypothetical protein